jgi:hypothetical protein
MGSFSYPRTSAPWSRQLNQPTCVLTRFELRYPWSPFLLRRHYRRVSRVVGSSRGLLAHVLLRSSGRCYFTLSLWTDPAAIVGAADRTHVLAVKFARANCRAVWSTQWHLTSLSRSARQWPETNWTEIAQASGIDHPGAGALTYCTGLPTSILAGNRRRLSESDPHDEVTRDRVR